MTFCYLFCVVHILEVRLTTLVNVPDTLWQMNLTSNETMQSEPYPVREGEPDFS